MSRFWGLTAYQVIILILSSLLGVLLTIHIQMLLQVPIGSPCGQLVTIRVHEGHQMLYFLMTKEEIKQDRD